ncbi:autotransporter outer membrane beta-barrel domain-containing protein, partial [Escherichia sp. HC-CC]
LGSNQVIVEEQGKLSGFGGVAGNLSNSGIVDLTTYMPGNILTVGGNYTGRNGLILLQTETGGDNSKTRLLCNQCASTKGFTVSLEAGYSWKAGEFTDNYKGSHEWYVQPQLQVVRMNVKSD